MDRPRHLAVLHGHGHQFGDRGLPAARRHRAALHVPQVRHGGLPEPDQPLQAVLRADIFHFAGADLGGGAVRAAGDRA